MDPLEERHLEVIPRLRRDPEILLGFGEQIEGPQQILAREAPGKSAKARRVAFRRVLGIVEPRRIDRHHHQVADEPRQLAAQQAQIVARLDGPAGEIEHLRRVLVGNRLDDVEQEIAADEAEHRRDIVCGDAARGERNQLIERALAVAKAAFGGACQRLDGGRLGVDAFRRGDALQLVGDGAGADGPELELLGARADRVRNLVQLRRRHDELHVRRRLLDRFQQGVEGMVRELMHLVDDEDLEAVADRPQAEAADDHLTDLVHLGVGGGVDLEDVDVAALGDFDAGIADPARVHRRTVDAVERLGEDAGGGRLADATGAGEDECLADAAAGDGVAQRVDHATLADHLVEPLRAPLASEDLIGHGTGTVWANGAGLRRPQRWQRLRRRASPRPG